MPCPSARRKYFLTKTKLFCYFVLDKSDFVLVKRYFLWAYGHGISYIDFNKKLNEFCMFLFNQTTNQTLCMIFATDDN